jgi:hypothetical protein
MLILPGVTIGGTGGLVGASAKRLLKPASANAAPNVMMAKFRRNLVTDRHRSTPNRDKSAMTGPVCRRRRTLLLNAWTASLSIAFASNGIAANGRYATGVKSRLQWNGRLARLGILVVSPIKSAPPHAVRFLVVMVAVCCWPGLWRATFNLARAPGLGIGECFLHQRRGGRVLQQKWRSLCISLW